MERPAMRVTGPVLDAPNVRELTRFYERLLGWDIEELEGPRPGHPSGDGWSRLRPADRSTKIEIQFEENFERPGIRSACGRDSRSLGGESSPRGYASR